jgi:hypothetical protein
MASWILAMRWSSGADWRSRVSAVVAAWALPRSA